jgi:hypothetical protein
MRDRPLRLARPRVTMSGAYASCSRFQRLDEPKFAYARAAEVRDPV